MSWYIRIDDEDDLKWLRKLMSNTLASPSSPAYQTSYLHLYNWDRYLANPVRAKAAAADVDCVEDLLTPEDREKIVPKKRQTRGRKGSRSTKNKKSKEIADPYVCPEHTNYGGKSQRPRNDCDRCWELYKTFNPLIYKQKRSEFDLLQLQKKRKSAT